MTGDLFSHPYFGLVLSVAAYAFGCWVKARTRSPLANPLLISTVVVAVCIECTPLTLEQYRVGGVFITLFIVPATVALAMQISRQWAVLRANALPVLGGCVAGSVVSVGGVWLLCGVLGIDGVAAASLLPKSVTTAIAMDLSVKGGGVPSLTVSAVVLTGMTSAVCSPLFLKMFRLGDPVAAGVAMGTAGHAIGTARALEMGETEGAFSGIALGVAGVATSVLFALL